MLRSTAKLRFGWLSAAAALTILALTGSAFAAGTMLVNQTARFVQNAPNLGPETPSKVINITVRLNLHNRAERDALLKQLYNPASPQYHQWLTTAEYAARFGPTAAESAAVQDFLKAQGFTVTYVHPNNMYVNARGTVATAQKAFNVQINRFNVLGKTRYANTSNPVINHPAAAYIASVQGLHEMIMHPHSVPATNPDTGKPFAPIPLKTITGAKPNATANAVPPAQFYENQCWRAVETHAFNTSNNLPASYYKGNRYGGDITGGPGHYPPCGYEPAALQIAYGMNAAYSAGIDGTGETVAIVDAWGSPTAGADFGVFSDQFGLPDNNFADYNPFGADTSNTSWAGETTLDIEWSHSMAPSANIALVRSVDNYDNNLQNSVQWALDNLSNLAAVSNSYGEDEYEDDLANAQAWDDLNAYGASKGVSVNYSTGDDGDYYRAVGAYSVSVPSDTPHATAIGGTSDFINADYTMKFQTGWGTDLMRLSTTSGGYTSPVCASTLTYTNCFYFGAGGGESVFFGKPTWQSSLPGTGRQQPDISMTADPYTGVTIIYSYSSPGEYFVGVIGGTSASCPMFSGVWALVNQKAGKPAGQAAPLLYSLKGNAIRDVKQASAYTPTDVTGTIFTGGAPDYLSAYYVVTPDTSTKFTSGFYQGTSGRYYAISFGTDSSLVVNNGWDNVTGLGTPNGWSFINAAAKLVH